MDTWTPLGEDRCDVGHPDLIDVACQLLTGHGGRHCHHLQGTEMMAWIPWPARQRPALWLGPRPDENLGPPVPPETHLGPQGGGADALPTPVGVSDSVPE